MTVDEYLRSCKGVPPLPEKWHWEIGKRKDLDSQGRLIYVYDIYILDEWDECISQQTLEPWNPDIERNRMTINDDFLTTIRGTYYSLFPKEKPDLLHTMSLPN